MGNLFIPINDALRKGYARTPIELAFERLCGEPAPNLTLNYGSYLPAGAHIQRSRANPSIEYSRNVFSNIFETYSAFGVSPDKFIEDHLNKMDTEQIEKILLKLLPVSETIIVLNKDSERMGFISNENKRKIYIPEERQTLATPSEELYYKTFAAKPMRQNKVYTEFDLSDKTLDISLEFYEELVRTLAFTELPLPASKAL